ncbi:MAG: hypothetical protein J6A28_02045 [Clostridia bacterium]|nr:hypothetical protein [Clostridia bacterium]
MFEGGAFLDKNVGEFWVSSWLVIVLAVVLYLVVPIIVWSCIKNEKIKKSITIALLVIYLLISIACILSFTVFAEGHFVMLFDFSGRWAAKTIDMSFSTVTLTDAFISLITLLPVGMAIEYLSRKQKIWVRIVMILGIAVASGLLIELIQFILPIYTPVRLSDVIFSAASVAVGAIVAWLYLLFVKAVQKVGKEQQKEEARKRSRKK